MKTCVTCGKELVRRPGESHTNFSDRKFCDKVCRRTQGAVHHTAAPVPVLSVRGIRILRGSEAYKAKLTEAQIKEIRFYHSRGVPTIDIAAKYGVSPATVSSIAHFRTWKHVD